MTLVITIIADLVVPRERGRYQRMFSAAFAFSSIAGPLLGGFITDALSRRWIFYVNVPIGAPALALILFGLRRPHHKVPHSIDYAGIAYLTVGTVALLLVLTLGGIQFPWSSPFVIGLSAAAVVLTLLLMYTERRSPEPILSPHIHHNKVFVIATSTMDLTFMGLFDAAVFLPLFFQLVLGHASAREGLMMAPMTGGVVISSFLGGQLVVATGRYKIFPVVGLAAATSHFLRLCGLRLQGRVLRQSKYLSLSSARASAS